MLSLVWELCGLAEAQGAVFSTVFIEGLALWIWFLYMIWHTGFTVKDCILCGNICYHVSRVA